MSNANSSRPKTAWLYTRISEDRDLERGGVTRQGEDLHRLAASWGAEVTRVLEDNDISGEGKKRRPDFETLIEGVRERKADLFLATDVDRYLRGFKPYVELYEAAEHSKVIIGWQGGSADFATGKGLLELGLRAEFAREELRKIRERVTRWHGAMKKSGRWPGGATPFGLERLNETWSIREDQAKLVREAAHKILQGHGLRALAREWNERGVKTSRGRQWTAAGIRKMLMSLYISGRREWLDPDTDEVVLVDAVWPAIIPAEQSDQLRRLLGDPVRWNVGSPRRYLLAGLARCQVCGRLLEAKGSKGTRRMSCRVAGHGTTVTASRLEEVVTAKVFQRLEDGSLRPHLERAQDMSLVEELKRVQQDIVDVTHEWTAKRLPKVAYLTAIADLKRQEDELRLRVDQQRSGYQLEGLPENIAEAWDDPERMPFHLQRAFLRYAIDEVRVGPSQQPTGHHGFDPRRVQVLWADQRAAVAA